MRPLGDRRSRIRLEVVGSLWGTLEASTKASVVNISSGGALIASPVAVPLDSRQTIRFVVEGHEIQVETRVRRLERVAEPGPQYRIGLEFIEAPAGLIHALE
jgi:c-di-GMP-binding flagellar brake protein YcgR